MIIEQMIDYNIMLSVAIPDPADLRNSLSNSSAFAKRTISNALRGGSASEKRRSTRSVEISYEDDDDSSSFFHVRGNKRKAERVVEIDSRSPESSFDRTNTFSNARDYRDRRKGSSGKFGSGSARKFRR